MPTLMHVVAGKAVKIHALPPFNDRTVSLFHAFLARAPRGVLGIDVETTAIEDDPDTGPSGPFDPDARLRLVQLGGYTSGWVFDPHVPSWRAELVAALADRRLRFASHTAYDPLWIHREFGIDLAAEERSIDALPLACLVYPSDRGGHGLKELTAKLMDDGLTAAEGKLTDRFRELAPVGERTPKKLRRWGFTNIPIDDPVFLSYSGLDAVYVRHLIDILGSLLTRRETRALSVREQRIAQLAIGMQQRGHLLDLERAKGVRAELQTESDRAEQYLRRVLGFTPRSPRFGEYLADHGVRITAFTGKGAPATDRKTIEKYAGIYRHGRIGKVLRAKLYMSRRANILTNLKGIIGAADADGYVHPRINTMAAITGRMSIVSPALQTFKKTDTRLRGCFIAAPRWTLVGADYAGQEIALAAAFSRDQALVRIVTQGLNQHDVTAERIFGAGYTPDQRHKSKTLDFAQQYGAGPRAIARQLGISELEARGLWEGWRRAYSGLVTWSEHLSMLPEIVNPWGRVIPVDPLRPYTAGNYMIQSSGRDVLGDAMVRLDQAGWGQNLWLPIHDELILHVPESKADEAMAALDGHMRTTVAGIELHAEPKVLGHRWSGTKD